MRVVIAMSGGVDSSVAAALLVDQGHEVVGVHMRLHDGAPSGTVGRCCGVDDAMDARRVCEALGIPFYVMDLRDEFRSAVMDYFVDTWVSGATPNPCVPCNGVVRFGVLMNRARSLGASHLATGHYARVDDDGVLRRAADADKDQSYFLFQLHRDVLRRTLFPLGELTKAEVRQRASALGLTTADKPESQEICFIPDDDHTAFVRGRRPDLDGSGHVVDEAGRVLGSHDGYWRFTVGQRRGIGVAVGHSLYVLSVDADTHRVTVGPADRLQHQALRASRMRWQRQPRPGEALVARIRHRGALHPCEVEAEGTDAIVRFQAPARAVTPGQAVVVYGHDEVVGGGWIRGVAP